jgi:cbb3-type cytochrome oxidase subunit 3
MKLSDIMGHAGLAGYAQIALLLFFGVFLAVVWRLYFSSARHSYEAAARLPLEADPTELPARPEGPR